MVEFVQDGDLRDAENIALNPKVSTTELIEDYFKREVQPHVPDAWINADKRDEKDGEIGIVGYAIPFNRHFYVYQPPRDLAEIDADLDAVSRRDYGSCCKRCIPNGKVSRPMRSIRIQVFNG